MSLSQYTTPLFLEEDELYCSEEDGDVVDSSDRCQTQMFKLPEFNLADDEELKELFFNEGKSDLFRLGDIGKDEALIESRYGAVDWILKVQSFYSFSPLTAVLAVNYLDRFIFLSLEQSFQKEKAWMTQLAAVACLSLAAKVEEIHVPLLLDLQVEETKYVFEAKTIQKMELLVLSALEWKMHPLNPITFLDQFTSKLNWSSPIYAKFIQRCELVMLLALFDARNMLHTPSVMAATTMLHVISHLLPGIGEQVGNQLLDILGINKEKVSECLEFIRGLSSLGHSHLSNKRKFGSLQGSPGSPTGVIDASFSYDSSNSSWSAASSSVTSSPESQSKRVRADHRYPHYSLDEA